MAKDAIINQTVDLPKPFKDVAFFEPFNH